METLYRKVAVSERKPKSSGFYWIENIVGEMKSSHYESLLEMFTGDYANFWLEPIPDPTAQLQADKEELLEMLEAVKRLEPIICMGGAVAEQWKNEAQALNEMMSGIDSLIQKMKQ